MAKRYESPLDVMVGTIDKLKGQRDSQLKKIAELTLQLKFLLPKYADSSLVTKLEKELETAESKLEDAEIQLDLMQKRGNASLEGFLTQENLDLVKDTMNANKDKHGGLTIESFNRL